MSVGVAPSLAPLSLRQDLRLYEGPTVAHAPSWMLYDPVRHRYFQIDRVAFAILGAWSGSLTRSALAQRVLAITDEWLSPEDLDRVFDFAERNELVETPAAGWEMHARRAAGAREGWLMWLVHNYLFIKIPVVRPRRFFEKTSFLVAPFYTRTFLIATVLAALAGLYLVSREWSAFIGTFPAFLSIDGAMTYAATLFGVKLLHELGHAYTAARHRCRVSSIGIAFMVMMPMLYCDVTDSWKLTDRRKRLAIDSAGILVELILAVYASLFWVVAPEGPLRTAAFLVASASIVSSLAVNLNPFMRFDGYLMLADALNVPNLQTRAFALFRWKLRELLFALGEPSPEQFTATKRLFVLVYAGAIIVYRAIVYTGIAFLVYHTFFKMLGIALFAVELGWFIIGPVAKEAAVWWTVRDRIVLTRRSAVSGALGVGLLLLVLFPFRQSVVAPAILDSASVAHVYPTSPGQIISIEAQRGERVVAGQTLAVMTSTHLAQDASLARIRLALVDARLQRRASLAVDKAETLSLDMERRLLIDKLEGLRREQADLVVKAPIAGIVRDLDPDLTPGRWIGRDEEIALITGPGAAVVKGYVKQDGVDDIAVGDVGTFYSDTFGVRGASARINHIAYSAAARIDVPYLASTNGGPIAAREGADHLPVPDAAIFPVTFALERGAAPVVERGSVLLSGGRESLAHTIIKNLSRVLVRESGF